MSFFEKYWFLIINIIAFVIALFDGLVWKDANSGFPIFTLLGWLVAIVIGGVYRLIKIIRNCIALKKILFLDFLILYITGIWFGFIGSFTGLLVGFLIF